ncbi:leucine zipper putative tumor suppressor 1 isoform X3 [Stigmatopora nigra]
MLRRDMGSVSSLVASDQLNSKHCKASELRLKNRTNQPRRNGGCSLDGLLKCSFTQASLSPVHPSKGLSHSPSGRSEDFFYIKVSHKPTATYHRGGSMEDNISVEVKPNERPKQFLISGTDGTTAEKSLVRSTAYKPLIPKSEPSTKAPRNSLDNILSQLNNPKSPDILHKPDTPLGNLSDSGHNSMSSLPTQSTNGSASIGPLSHNDHPNCSCKGAESNLCPWVYNGSRDGNYRAGLSLGVLSSQSHGEGGSSMSSDGSKRFSETVGGSRTPLTTDETLIETLEQKLQETDNEMQEFQASQMATSTQQTLQVGQLQAENARLKEDLANLSRERDLMERKLKTYEAESTQLAPTLEETQWEVCQKAGEISLLKQQLRDSHEDVSHKLNEIVSLRAQLKEIAAKADKLAKENKDNGDRLRSRTIQVEVCQNELQRKMNEANLLREKVGKLAKHMEGTSQLEPCGSTKEEYDKQTSTELLHIEVERLQQKLCEEKAAQASLTLNFDQERCTWNKEKDKVIKYQKQLQINYLQVHKKNQDLERLMKELTAELEARADLGLELKYTSRLKTYDDVIATEI